VARARGQEGEDDNDIGTYDGEVERRGGQRARSGWRVRDENDGVSGEGEVGQTTVRFGRRG
jgi:hypothetical protein